MGTPPPLPIRGNRLTVTEKMLRSRLAEKGLTGSISADLNSVCNALMVLEGQNQQLQPAARGLSAAFNRWLNANHAGEISMLQSTYEFQAIRAFVADYPVPGPPGAPPGVDTPASTLKSIGVALYTVLNFDANFKLSIDERLNRMRQVVTRFDKWLSGVKQSDLQLDNAFRGIFIAPEYYFTKPDASGERHFLDLAAKNQIDLALKQLSKAFPHILLVPGTIHYDVVMDKEQAGYDLLKATRDRIVREKALASPKAVLDHTMSHKPDWSAYHKVHSINTLATSLLNQNTKPRRVHNVTSLILNGTVWGSYDKHSDFYEARSNSPDQSMFIPGTQDECPEIGDGVRKFKFGVEICYDHGNGVLKRRSPPNLHFHIVVSDDVANAPGNMAMKNGGYFLHASTDHSETVVYRRHDNGQLVNETASLLKLGVKYGGDFLEMFQIQLPPV